MAIVSMMMQPNWQTFVDDLATLFIQKQGDETIESWRNKDFTERVAYFVENDALPRDSRWVEEALYRSACLSSKSDKTAEEYRQNGNKKFQYKMYKDAVDDYTQCIRHSEIGSVSLGYANRSAALVQLNQNGAAVLDANRALENNYPEKLQYKLYRRRSACYAELGMYEKAKIDLDKAIATVDLADVTEKKKGQLREEMEKTAADLAGHLSTNNGTNTADDIEKMLYPRSVIPSVIGGCSSHMKQASKRVSMKYTPEKGRHLVAAADLKPGNELIVERPYAGVLLPDHYNTNCHHCFTKTTAPVPCLHCPIALYCTSRCRDASWENYHSIECPFLGIMHAIGVAHLAFRVVIVTGYRKLLAFRPSSPDGCVDTECVYEFGYESVYNLVHHTENMNTEDLVQYTLCAVLLVKCLIRSTFFSDPGDSGSSQTNGATNTNNTRVKTSDKLTDDNVELNHDHMVIGGYLLRHIQQLVCNAHAVGDLALGGANPQNEMVCDMNDVRLATAIYPTASLMNHSCEPNIISNFLDETLVVRCARPIKKGEEIFNCYGPQSTRMDRHERQRMLEQQYFFTCRCTGCGEHSTRMDKHKALKCSVCEGPLPRPQLGEAGPDLVVKCLDCGKLYTKADLDKILPLVFQSQSKMAEGLQLADKGDVKGARDLLKECLRLQKQVLYREHEDMACTSDQIARLYTLQEKYAKAEPYVQFSVKVIGRIHGYGSVEYGLEVKKLAQIQFNALMVAKCAGTIEKALEIMRPNFGEESDMVNELIRMRNVLHGAKDQF